MARINFDEKEWGKEEIGRSGNPNPKCHNCGEESRITVSGKDALGSYLGCKSCIDTGRSRGGSMLGEGLGPDLHQKVGGKGRTVGKTWEIAKRGFAEDGFTVINTETGKPAQY